MDLVYVLLPIRGMFFIPDISCLQSPGMKFPSLSPWSVYPGGQYGGLVAVLDASVIFR